MPTSTTSPIAILRRLASGDLSADEARLALSSLIPHRGSPSQKPRTTSKPIGKRSRPTPVSWEKPITTWEDVTERFQYALRFAPNTDPWEVFSQARAQYHAQTR